MKIRIFIFFILSLFLIVVFKAYPTKKDFKRYVNKIKNIIKKENRTENLREYIDRINGKQKKRNIFLETQNATKLALNFSANNKKYKRVMEISFILSLIGGLWCIYIRNFILFPIVVLGLYFLPQWLTKFYVYKYKMNLNDELSNSLNAVTSSYLRHNDFKKSIEENVKYMKIPVKNEFETFLRNITYINSNMTAELENLYEKFDNNIFKKWVLNVIMCQNDHTLSSTLPSIVQNFSILAEQQAENETRMYQPITETVTMIILSLIPIFIYGFILKDIGYYLFHTIVGQTALAIHIYIIFKALNKAIILCEPLEMEL